MEEDNYWGEDLNIREKMGCSVQVKGLVFHSKMIILSLQEAEERQTVGDRMSKKGNLTTYRT